MSTPVAASRALMLRPSRPMMRPFISSLGSGTTRHGLLGHVVAGVAPDGQRGDFPGLAGGDFPGLGFDALHHAGGLGAHFPFHGTEQ